MSVDNHSNIPNNYTQTGVNGSVSGLHASEEDMRQLQSLFVSAMSQSLSGGGSTNDVLFDMVDHIQETSDERQDMQRQQDRRQDIFQDVSALTVRKDLDQSEIRSAQMKSEYADNSDRRAETQNDYQQKKQRTQDSFLNREAFLGELPAECFPISRQENVSNVAGLSSTSNALLNFSTEIATGIPVFSSGQPSSVVSQSVATSTFGAMPVNPIASHSIVFPQNITQANTTVSTTPTAVSVLTIFSLAGRLAVEKDKVDGEKTLDDKRKSRKNRSSSSFGTAVFEAVKAAEQEGIAESFFAKEQTKTLDGNVIESENDPVFGAAEQISTPLGYRKENRSMSSRDHADSMSGYDDLREQFAKQDEEKQTERRLLQKFDEFLSAIPADSLRLAEYQNPASEPIIPLSEQGDGGRELSERILYIRRIVAACQSTAHRNGQVRIKIDLAELGVLTLRTKSQNNRLSVSFEATTNAAVRFLNRDLSILKTTLAENDVVLDEVEIRLVN